MIFDILWRTRWRRNRLSKFYSRLIAKAARAKNRDEEDKLICEFMFEKNLVDGEIALLETLKLQNEAERLDVPFPHYSENRNAWEQGFKPGTYRLSVRARTDLRSQIRKEKRERLENHMLWASHVIMPIIGLIGAVMALLSLIASFHKAR